MALRQGSVDRSALGAASAAVVGARAGVAPREDVAQGGRRLAVRMVFIAVLLIWTAIFIYPFIWLVSASLKTTSTVFEGSLIPADPQWHNYLDLFARAPIATWAWNSAVVAILAAVTVTLSSAFVAFAFAYFRFPGRDLLFGIVLATLLLPGAVTLIPTFLIWDTLGFTDTLVPLWAGNLFGSAFYIFLMRQFFLTLPRELFEAARVDGADPLRIWWSLALPLTRPALIVVFVFELKAAWTDLLKPLIYLHDVALFTLPRGLKAIIDNPSIGGQKEWELLAAAGVIVTVPMIIVFFLGQRYFLEGISTTGSKG
jgi:multiple sugar transport system permease protein